MALVSPLLAIFLMMLLFDQEVDSKRDQDRHYSTRNNTLISLPLIETAFDGNRDGVAFELMDMCRHVRLNNFSKCTGHHSIQFRKFLIAMAKLVPNVRDIALVADPFSWDRQCKEQQLLNDARVHSLCVASAFTLIPFPLDPTTKVPEIKERPSLNQNWNKDFELEVVTVLTNHRQVVSPTLESACKYGLSTHVLGVGLKNFYKHGLGGKANLLKNFMDKLPLERKKKTIVLFIDGADVVIQSGKNELIDRFLATRARILFSAEHSCYPLKYWPMSLSLGKWLGPCRGTCSNSRFLCDNVYPPNPLIRPLDPSNRWLNSGAFIGYALDLQRMLDAVSRLPADLIAQWPGYDQGLYTHLFLSKMWGIELDYASSIFFSFGIIADKTEAVPGRLAATAALVPYYETRYARYSRHYSSNNASRGSRYVSGSSESSSGRYGGSITSSSSGSSGSSKTAAAHASSGAGLRGHTGYSNLLGDAAVDHKEMWKRPTRQHAAASILTAAATQESTAAGRGDDFVDSITWRSGYNLSHKPSIIHFNADGVKSGMYHRVVWHTRRSTQSNRRRNCSKFIFTYSEGELDKGIKGL